MPHKRSYEGKIKQQKNKNIRNQVNEYIRQNCFHDLETNEEANQLSPYEVKEYLLSINGGAEVKVVRPELYGSLICENRFVAQAAEGLVLEGKLK